MRNFFVPKVNKKQIPLSLQKSKIQIQCKGIDNSYISMQYYLGLLIDFISNHSHYAYIILFFGAICDTLFPISFLIYGEIFFLSGAILAGMGVLNIFILVPILYAGGIIGDNTSYYIGHKYGSRILNWIHEKGWFSRIFKKESQATLTKMLEEKGEVSIIFARVWGPIARISPFIIGTLQYKYSKFFRYDLAGAIFWISIFISVGYFFGTNYENILQYIYNYIFLFLLIITSAVTSYLYLIKYLKLHQYIYVSKLRNQLKRKILKNILKHGFLYTTALLTIYGLFVYFIFFSGRQYENNYFYFWNTINDISSLKNINFDTYFIGGNSKKSVQPINFIVITNQDINQVFTSLGWQENKIILKDKISLKEYVKSYADKVLPITNLTFLGENQDFWYQMESNSNTKRIHLRGWNYGIYQGKKVYFITISDDEEYQIDLYNNFIAPLHEIDREVDKSRDFLYNQFKERYGTSAEILATGKDETQNYTTDGNIYIITL